MSKVHLDTVVTAVEQDLSRFYGFEPASSAASHLITKDELHASLGDDARSKPEWNARGGVWLVDGEDFFIGLHIADEVASVLRENDPQRGLSEDNLDAFCVVIEEVSHFHLILNRARAERTVSRLELECQGEIDKLLVCALTLQRQSGDSHILPLARKLYDGAHIVAEDHDLYWQATRFAARFWYSALREREALTEDLRARLQTIYRASWSEKGRAA